MSKQPDILFECASCGFESPKWMGRCPSCSEWNSFKETRKMYGPVSREPSRGAVRQTGRSPARGAGPTDGADGNSAGGRAGSASRGGGQTGLGLGGGAGDTLGTGNPLGTSGGAGRKSVSKKKSNAVVASLSLRDVPDELGQRDSTGMAEFDMVTGGGVLRGSSVLIGGEPGIGKSTLLLQAATQLSKIDEVLYLAGEESAAQIKLRAKRLGLADSDINILPSTHIEDVLAALDDVQPVFIILDSVQTLYAPEATGTAGSPTQIRYCTWLVSEWCRVNNAVLFLVAHVTKDGTIAGPKVLEHMVDVVLYFEEAEAGLRVLRSSKNRYGSTDEIGLFTMDSRGLVEVKDPSSLLVTSREGDLPPGVALCPVYEGSRILLVELQCLVVPNNSGFSRINSDRIDQRRVARIAAVLEKHVGVPMSNFDVYVNVAGGLKVGDTALDLALAAALYGARTDSAMPSRLALMGEVSLSGELRSVPHARRRFQSCIDRGFVRVIGPRAGEQVAPARAGVGWAEKGSGTAKGGGGSGGEPARGGAAGDGAKQAWFAAPDLTHALVAIFGPSAASKSVAGNTAHGRPRV